jgi:MFS superfamily sulfate permease-like transporter
MPVPIELILVISGTGLAYLFKFNQRWSIQIVGDLPRGLPMPSLPPVHIFPALLNDAISIAIVSYAVNISMAKLFAKKNK